VYEQRDIVLIPFPYSDLTGSKQRPALIISNECINKTEDRVCCLVTSKAARHGLLIDSFERDKLPYKSWVKPHRLFTIHEKIIRKKLSKVSVGFHDNVLRQIDAFLKRN
jgi:mRNA interferase MazF